MSSTSPIRAKSSNDNIFNNEINDKQNREKDQGVMNLGENCHYCKQLDFLPFRCEYCHNTYCSNHRTLDSHSCPGKAKFETGVKNGTIAYDGPTASSLFPDREKNKAKIDELIKNSKPKPTNILETQFRLGDVAKNTPNAFNKFKKFLILQKKKSLKSSSNGGGGVSIGKLFNSKKSILSKNKIVDIATLKKTAKGDAKVGVNDRIYIWCLYIDNSNDKFNEDDYLSMINVEKDRKPIWISKNWSVGRSLDSIADLLKIMNYNNSTRESSERLNIFKNDKEEVNNKNGENNEDDVPVLIENSDRVNKVFKNGSLIYLVKGSLT